MSPPGFLHFFDTLSRRQPLWWHIQSWHESLELHGDPGLPGFALSSFECLDDRAVIDIPDGLSHIIDSIGAELGSERDDSDAVGASDMVRRVDEVQLPGVPEAEWTLDSPVLPSTLVPEHMHPDPLLVWDQTDLHVSFVEAVGKFKLLSPAESHKTPFQPTK